MGVVGWLVGWVIFKVGGAGGESEGLIRRKSGVFIGKRETDFGNSGWETRES